MNTPDTLIFPPTPLVVRLDIAAPMAGPGIAELIGRALTNAGAEVSFTSPYYKLPEHAKLGGLKVIIDRVTRVYETEVIRWEGKA